MGMKGFGVTKCATAILLATLANGAYAAGSITVLYGQKALNKNDWEPVESQSEVGFGIEIQELNWPVALVASYLKSDDSSTAVDPDFGVVGITGETTELGIGARKYLGDDKTRLFIEGGLASVSAEMGAKLFGVSVSDSGSAIGYWLGGGVDVMLNDAWSVGVLGRISGAEVSLFGADGEAGGVHFNAFASYHFK